ncbi:ParB/RepB/Spo0J family partition protein [Chitinophagaceae bacterium LB-8]|uniref:ParB/RepB/Spo0J family partition protein n=1 Tax=Paraflavisolibacter caeni TaxID=2982496 RepID=A0A9X2XWA7_9BACT|nr:hypothetical protein [Paraflavisolibacter caeni]MCU7549841.1 ParB/RepB/Spo0J family partition protein [Paraflavisolibacter caeni]
MPNDITYKDRLNRNEFALNESVRVTINVNAAELTFTRKDDTVVMNLSMPFEVNPDAVQVGPGPIRFDRCGVLKFNDPNFNEGRFKELFLSIIEDGGLQPAIIIESRSQDIQILTGGQKGEHGNTFFE